MPLDSTDAIKKLCFLLGADPANLPFTLPARPPPLSSFPASILHGQHRIPFFPPTGPEFLAQPHAEGEAEDEHDAAHERVVPRQGRQLPDAPHLPPHRPIFPRRLCVVHVVSLHHLLVERLPLRLPTGPLLAPAPRTLPHRRPPPLSQAHVHFVVQVVDPPDRPLGPPIRPPAPRFLEGLQEVVPALLAAEEVRDEALDHQQDV